MKIFGSSVTHQLVYSSILLALYFAIISPVDILLKNYDEFDFGLMQVFLYSLLVLLITFSTLVIIGVFFNAKVKRYYVSIILFLLCVSIINSQWLIGEYGVFDGRGLTINKYSLISITQLLIMGIVLLVVPRLINTLITFLVLYLVITFSLTIVLFISNQSSISKKPVVPSVDFVNLSKTKPNYLYIILDEVYGGSAEQIFRTKQKLAEKFTGFTNYTNTSGLYPTTIMSVPAILTGQYYREGDDINGYYRESFSTSPLLNKFEENKVDYKVHSVRRYCFALPENSCSTMLTFGRNALSVSDEYMSLVNIALFKAFPDLAKNYVYRDGKWLIRKPKIGPHIEELNYFVNNLKAQNDKSTFRLFHTTLTHSPVQYDQRCNFLTEAKERNFENYIGQDFCGFFQVGRIIDKLKELGVYDNTFIVVSSDHGRRFIPEDLKDRFDISGVVSSGVYGYAHAALMVKPFNADGPIEITGNPASLIDIMSMMTSSFDHSNPVFSTSKVRKYYHYNWNNDWQQKQLPPFTDVFTISGDITNPENWRIEEDFLRTIVDKKLAKNFKCGETFVFGNSDKNADSYRVDSEKMYYAKGLSGIEKWGRWSAAKKVTVYFNLTNKCDSGELIINAQAFVTEKKPVQLSNVYLNDRYVGDIRFELGEKNPRNFGFNIQNNIVNPNGLNILEFQIDNPVSPKSVGHNNDQRHLAIGFISMTFL